MRRLLVALASLAAMQARPLAAQTPAPAGNAPPPSASPPAAPPPQGEPLPPVDASPPYPAPASPMPYPYEPPRPAAPPPDAHTHSGFFLRMSLGSGYLRDSVSVSGGGYGGQVTAKGPAGAFEIDIGGSIAPGFSVSGAFLLHSIVDTTITGDTRTFVDSLSGTTSPSRLTQNPQLSMLAVMADVYPSPNTGFHLGGGFGFASMQARQGAEGDGSNGGFGIAAHAGHEWWVADYWGLGVQARLLYARTRSPYASGRQTDQVVTLTVAFSATYN